jgi:hypothetical protein
MKKGQKKSNLTKEEQFIICDYYVNHNKSMQEIADMYSRSEFFISVILEKNGIKRRKITRSTFNLDYFEKIDTKDKAYFLGLLLADGCNYNDGFTLSLQDEDYKIIELFKKYINFTGNINYRKLKNPKYKGTVRIKIHSKIIADQLSKYGVIPNKSLNTFFPNIPKELESHFIRGVFDGDGSICICTSKKTGYKSSHFSIIGFKAVISKIQEIMTYECDLRYTKLQNNKLHSKNTLYIKYGGYKNISKIFDWLYKDCEDLYIDRKFLKFKKIKNERV